MTAQWTLPGCPGPPHWELCWDRLAAPFLPVLEPLAACAQNPVFHGEGDVLIHTRGVVGALVQDEAWRAQPPPVRSVLLCAALLHDIAKPAASRVVEGRIRTHGHASMGAAMVRRLLYRGAGQGLAPPGPRRREQVVALVRHHGLPIAFMKKQDPGLHAIRATAGIPGGWLTILGRADILGRVSRDRDELLERVTLFRELCKEQGCLDGPRSFASGEARMRYLRGDLDCPDAPLPEPDGSRVTLLCGLPGAGKDTWARAHGQGRAVISLDRMRRRLGIKPDGDQGGVAKAARSQARPLLAGREPLIWSAANTTRAMRQRLVRYFRRYKAHVTITYIETPYQELIRRNRERGHGRLPDQVLERLVDGLLTPAPAEANRVEFVPG